MVIPKWVQIMLLLFGYKRLVDLKLSFIRMIVTHSRLPRQRVVNRFSGCLVRTRR